MLRNAVLGLALLGVMLAGGAASGRGPSDPEKCERLEAQAERVCRGNASLAACDRVTRAHAALCGRPVVIYASSSAQGSALDLLGDDYEVLPIEQAVRPFVQAHVVVGPPDLDDPGVLSLLRDAHASGRTIAIAGATQAEADRFHQLILGGTAGASCNPIGRSPVIALYGLQKALLRRPDQLSSYCAPSVDALDEKSSRRWLRRSFADEPPAPRPADATPQVGLGSDPTNINDLVSQVHCSHIWTVSGGSAQTDVFIASLRDFDDEQDYYSVENEAQWNGVDGQQGAIFRLISGGPNMTADATGPALPGTELLFSEPATQTAFVSSYTNSQSTTVGGSVGYSAEKGPDVEASASVTIGESKTVTVPPVQILNESGLADADPSWSFIVQNYVGGTTFAVVADWLWIIPRAAYPDGGTGSGSIFFLNGPTDVDGPFTTCNVSYPFTEWAVDNPVVTSVSPTSAEAGGGVFEILGESFFPSIVEDVLLDGDALTAGANYETVSSTNVKVTVPSGVGKGDLPVQVNTLFNGQTLPSNNNVDIKITD